MWEKKKSMFWAGNVENMINWESNFWFFKKTMLVPKIIWDSWTLNL